MADERAASFFATPTFTEMFTMNTNVVGIWPVSQWGNIMWLKKMNYFNIKLILKWSLTSMKRRISTLTF